MEGCKPKFINYFNFFRIYSVKTSSYHWARGHRVHHKYTDTDADPHNSKRGLFFSHIGWIMLKEHPEVTKRSLEMDMSDVEKDKVCMFGLK